MCRTSFLYHFFVVLIMMSSCGVYKQRRSFSIPIIKPSFLLAAVFINNIDIPFYFNCANRKFPSCKISSLESSRYIRYIQSNKFGYDVIEVILFQFQNIVSQYARLESELEEVLTKVFYL